MILNQILSTSECCAFRLVDRQWHCYRRNFSKFLGSWRFLGRYA